MHTCIHECHLCAAVSVCTLDVVSSVSVSRLYIRVRSRTHSRTRRQAKGRDGAGPGCCRRLVLLLKFPVRLVSFGQLPALATQRQACWGKGHGRNVRAGASVVKLLIESGAKEECPVSLVAVSELTFSFPPRLSLIAFVYTSIFLDQCACLACAPCSVKFAHARAMACDRSAQPFL